MNVARLDVAPSHRVYRIAVRALPHLISYVYLVLGDATPTLIDAGSGEGESTPDVLSGLKCVATDFGEAFSPGDIGRILLTHAHVDHFGGGGELAGILGAELAVHSLDRHVVTAHDAAAHAFTARARLFLLACGVPTPLVMPLIEEFGFTPGRTRNAMVAHELVDGEEIGSLRVHHTPGHSPGHVCFELGDVLFLGDHLLSRTTPQIWSQDFSPMTGLGNYLTSLDKLATIATSHSRIGSKIRGLAGHEEILPDVMHRIDMVRRNHQRREARLLTLLTSNTVSQTHTVSHAMTAFEVTERLYTAKLAARSLMAIADVAARLEHLALGGKLRVSTEASSVVRYRPLSQGFLACS